MSYENEEWYSTTKKFPPDFDISGKMFKALLLANEAFINLPNNDWDLDNYSVHITASEDKKYVKIGFLPNIDTFVDGIPFQIANRGMYKYGMGVSFTYDLQTMILLNTTFMR